MVRKTRGDQKTFAKVAVSVTSLVLLEGKDSQCIDVVLDFYRDNLIKDPERQERGSKSGHEFTNIQAGHTINQWRKFLCNYRNKSLPVKFISEEWQNEWHRERLARKAIYVMTEDYCYEFSLYQSNRKGRTKVEVRGSRYQVFSLCTCSSHRIRSCYHAVNKLEQHTWICQDLFKSWYRNCADLPLVSTPSLAVTVSVLFRERAR